MNSFPKVLPRVLSYPSLRFEEDPGNEVAHFRCGLLNKAQGNLYLWGGSLSFNDGGGFVTEKENSRCFKLYRVISSCSFRQTSANFSGVEF